MRINRKNAQQIVDAGMPEFKPGMEMRNATGDIDVSTAGYDYAIRSTTFRAAKAVLQKFYTVSLADFVDVVEGEGAWLEDMRVNRQFTMGGDFERSRISTNHGSAKIGNIGIANSPKTIVFNTFAEGFRYNEIELEKSMRALNWDIVGGNMDALKRHFDLGVQKMTFLGLKDEQTNTTGLLTLSDVTANTTLITKAISSMTADEFQSFVKGIVAAYIANCSYTAMPNRFVMPTDDFVGLTSASSSTFPIGSKLDYLTTAFKQATQNADFKILPLAYSIQAKNAGYVATLGKNRYVLYNKDVETVRVEHPLPFTMTPAVRVGALDFECAAMQQASGAVALRPAEIMYFDWAA
jgi:hypothetical protein